MISVNTKLATNFNFDLDKFAQKVREEVLIAGTAAMANVIYEEVHTRVPVDTGTLRDAIYRVYSPEKSSDANKLYRISWNKKKAPHGHLVEFGTSRAPAHPFIRPAADRLPDAIRAGNERMAEKLKSL